MQERAEFTAWAAQQPQIVCESAIDPWLVWCAAKNALLATNQERHQLTKMSDDGWYFSVDGCYIDVERDKDGKYSIYFRNRSTQAEAWLDENDSKEGV